MSKDSSGGFSVSAAKALFEAAKKPEVRNAAIAAAKNPFVRQTARTVAQDEKARGAVLNAVKNPSASNKFSAAFAVADANKKMGSSVASPSPPPPPPPHRTLSSASEVTTNRSLPGKLSTTHSQIRSQLENLHLGGTNAFRENDKPSKIITSYQNSTSTSSYSQPPPRPPPLPHLSYNSSNSYNTPVQNSSYNNSGFNSISQINEPHGIAQYTYSAVQPDELSLNVGDIIILKRIVDDQWFYGENKSNGLTGIVPKAYLQIKIPLSEPQPTLNYSNTSSGSQIYAIALYDYDSAQPGDLTFRMNQTIVVTKKINNEWLEGEVDGRKGIFPANFVDCPKIHEVPTKSLYQFNQTTNVNMEKVTAAFDYFSGVEADLSFKQGDTIYVVEHIDADWLMGELNGRRGLVPKTFLGSPFGSPKKSPKGLAEISTAFSPKKAIAIADYHSDDQKHLYVTRGDNILIVEDVDEYYYKGKLEIFKTLPAGILPKNVVKLVN